MTAPLAVWIGFGVFILVMLALDMGLFHRNSHVVRFKEAAGWTIFWVALAMVFNLGLWYLAGRQKALEFLTGYLIEYSLSVDNVFVFALIFATFGVPPRWQHKVLFWGILGALVMRLGMIVLGTALVRQFHWLLYVFGAFLIITGVKMAFQKTEEIHPERNLALRLFKKIVPMTHGFHGNRFLVRQDGRLLATPLLAVLVCVEVSDVIFAVDSIPAIFGVTLDPFIVYTSNVFAILGLRSLYFVLARALNLFHYLKQGLALVLCFIGVKMLLGGSAWEIGTFPALCVVAGVLGIAVAASILFPPSETKQETKD
ncbi:MAG: TerC family protein [Chthoniobacteraceae bacterium]|nr:TerC family protein [Chthoniobacteraceae bacterium]